MNRDRQWSWTSWRSSPTLEGIPRLLPLVALTVVAAACAYLLLLRGDDAPDDAPARDAAARFAAAWSAGADARAAAATDRPRAAARVLAANRKGLDGARATVRVALLRVDAERGTAVGRLRVAWAVPRIGTYAYTSTVRLARGDEGADVDDGWRVRFTSRTVHPRLADGLRLGTERAGARRAAILDRDGRALVKQRAVVHVGLQRDKVEDVDRSAAALAEALDLDAAPLARAVRGAGPKQFVEAVVLRRADYRRVAARLADVPGLLTVEGERPLTPSRAFGRALLGAVAPATAEQVKASRDALAPGDDVGQWGLEQRFDRRLAGTPSRRVVLRDTVTGTAAATLLRRDGTAPRPLRTTLSTSAQSAAEAALAGVGGNAAVVAVQPSSGDVLAVANRPVASTFDRALAGSYAPGSTFKIITTAALLRRGLDTARPVACPTRLTVDGRSFKNFEGSGGGSPTFADDFANSCNTAFISLSHMLPAADLGAVAKDYGLGRAPELGVGMARSHVPPGRDQVSRAAAMIGQDRIVASPLAMAGVAATVAEGRWRAPRLLADDPRDAGPRLPGGERDTLRALMRGVVTRGSGTALAPLPGEIAGKSGTAEYGAGDPPPTHAWFVAFRGDVAVAVLVERGRSGGSVAAPIAARFFSSLGTDG